jgi:hypothetical protein
MSDGSIRVVCSRCGSENNRTSRKPLHVFAWIYCFSFRQQRYRCLSCNSRFYGRRRRRRNPLQHCSDDPLGVAPGTTDGHRWGTKLAADSRSPRQTNSKRGSVTPSSTALISSGVPCSSTTRARLTEHSPTLSKSAASDCEGSSIDLC